MKLLPLLCLLSPWFGPGPAQEIRPGVVTVAEDADALLPCSLGSEQKVEKFDWRKDNGEYEKKEVFFYERGSHYNNGRPGQDEQFKDRVLFFEDELKAGNASIKIKRTRLEDSGNYTCVLFEPYKQEFHIRLNVDGALKIRIVSGAAPLPYVKQIPVGNSLWLLLCHVQGVPKPEVQWRNRAGKSVLLSAQDIHVSKDSSGRYHAELQLNVTTSDKYMCVATQREIFHQINNTLEVSIPDVVAVSKGADAVLPCFLNSKENIKNRVFNWKKDDKEVFSCDRDCVAEDVQFKGRLSLFEAELKSGNASIKIHNTQLTDSGSYTCDFPNTQQSYVILKVVGIQPNPEYSTGFVITVATVPAVILLLVAAIIIGVLLYRLSQTTPY